MACMLLFLFLPYFLLIALLIHSTAGNPFLVQDGWPDTHGTTARRLRFRTTGRGAEFFRLMGRFLRAYSMDEWPGLWSVARGDLRLREFLKWS